MKLPALILDADPTAALHLCEQMAKTAAITLELDAADTKVLQPVGICLLASSVRLANRVGKRVGVQNWSQQLRQALDSLGCQIAWAPGPAAPKVSLPVGTTEAASVTSLAEANRIANDLARRIAEFVPNEDLDGMLEDRYGLRIHHAVQPALAYVLSELLDNVFSHSRTEDYPNASALLTIQWYAEGDLMRVAVVDDGCGLLGSLRALPEPPRNHFEPPRWHSSHLYPARAPR